MGLFGVWIGMTLALVLVAAIEVSVILRTDWPKIVDRVKANMHRSD